MTDGKSLCENDMVKTSMMQHVFIKQKSPAKRTKMMKELGRLKQKNARRHDKDKENCRFNFRLPTGVF
jgi:hypothetical protein